MQPWLQRPLEQRYCSKLYCIFFFEQRLPSVCCAGCLSLPADHPLAVYTPRWFRNERDAVTGQLMYRYMHEYWQCRRNQDWSRCPDIFLWPRTGGFLLPVSESWRYSGVFDSSTADVHLHITVADVDGGKGRRGDCCHVTCWKMFRLLWL